jgi:hypothetical protein
MAYTVASCMELLLIKAIRGEWKCKGHSPNKHSVKLIDKKAYKMYRERQVQYTLEIPLTSITRPLINNLFFALGACPSNGNYLRALVTPRSHSSFSPFFIGKTFTASLALMIASLAPSQVFRFPVSKYRNACAVSTPLFIR